MRRLWVLVRRRLLISTGAGEFVVRRGTALAESMYGEAGDWTRGDTLLGGLAGIKQPADKSTVAWKRSEQERIKRLREERSRNTPPPD